MSEPRPRTVMTSFRNFAYLKATLQELAAEDGQTYTEALIEAQELLIAKKLRERALRA